MVDLSFGFRPTLTSIVAVSSLLLTATFAEGEVLQPKENLTVNPKLSADDKEATNVSGAACFIVAGERKSCLLIGDEVRYARFFSIDGKTLVPGQKIFLPNAIPMARNLRRPMLKASRSPRISFTS